MFVALLTPDDALANPTGAAGYRPRPNVVDELARARERHHLKNRILVFRCDGVELHSNVNPTYESLDLDDLPAAFATFERQAREWQILPEAEVAPSVPAPPIEDRSAPAQASPSQGGARRTEGSDALHRLSDAIDANSTAELDDWTSLRALLAVAADNARRPQSQLLEATEVNRIWAARPAIRPSDDEARLLLRAMLADTEPWTVPGWSMQPRRKAADLHALLCRLAYEDNNNAVRRGAVRLLISAPWRSSIPARIVLVERLLRPDLSWLHGSALALIERHGAASDFEHWDEQLERVTDAEAVLRTRATVLLRDRWRDGLKLVIEHPAAISQPVAEIIVAGSAKVGDAVWRRMLRSDAPQLRAVGVRVAAKRSALKKRDAVALMRDEPDVRVRVATVRAAVDRRWQLPVEDIRTALRDDNTLSFTSSERATMTVEALRCANPAARRDAISWLSTEGPEAYTAEALECWSQVATQVRSDLAEGFKRLHDPARAKMLLPSIEIKRDLPPDTALPPNVKKLVATVERTVEQLDSLREFVESKFRIAALTALAEHPEPGDRDLARNALNTEDHVVRALAVKVLGHLGNADDVPELVTAATKSYPDGRAAAAGAIISCLGSDHVAISGLIEDEGDSDLAGDLAAAGRSILDTEQLGSLLYHQHVGVRAAAADELVRRLSAIDARALLNRYPNSGRAWYFNVTARVDRSLNAPKWLAAGPR